MTEDEVAKLGAEVGTAETDDAFERDWTTGQLHGPQGFKAQAKALRAEFMMWKYLRDDARMRQAYDALKRVRSCIDYLERRLAVLDGSGPAASGSSPVADAGLLPGDPDEVPPPQS